MPRTVINKSISFDPQVFEKMESRRGRLLMSRSEYIVRCIMQDMVPGGQMVIEEAPSALTTNSMHSKARVDSGKKRAKSRKN